MSTSNSDSPKNFSRGAILFLAGILSFPVLIGTLAGRLYRPKPMTPSAEELESTDRFIVLFGNSLFEAGILPKRLSADLSRDGLRVKARTFTGGGWDALHAYQLAILNSRVLRPGRDIALIDVTLSSLNDGDTTNPGRLAAIRPEVAREILSLPGEPIEARLDIALGSLSGLYRYRSSIQGQMILPRLKMIADRAERVLARLNLLGPQQAAHTVEFITVPGKDYVVQEIKGDIEAFRAANRQRLQRDLADLEFGGYKLQAVRSAAKVLRDRGIQAYLVQMPVSGWLSRQLYAGEVGRRFHEELQSIAKDTDAKLLWDWSAQLENEKLYWDDRHMAAAASNAFTDALASRIAGDWPRLASRQPLKK